MKEAMQDTHAAWKALQKVMDPEIPVLSVVDIGIVRDIRWKEDGRLHVSVTPTYSGCPATEFIEGTIRDGLESAGFVDPLIERILAPAWTSEWISEQGREQLRLFGIAPPIRHATPSESPLVRWKKGEAIPPAGAHAIPCPRCGSVDTEKVSEFGSTACKALYRCTDCLEPFDYFKCI